MTTIDHRILIPAPPDAVWNYISDITHNPDWQIDCREIIFLTSRREGPGVRWRYATPGGRECVVAVTAWYNGLGYEYYYVDGMPFRENKGRIRLQEIPEGTIVQWTFTYQLGGFFGGMRNALGTSREVDHTIADSLKTLWQKIKQSGGTSRVYEAKSLMRDAPDVEARSAYQPRHPSASAAASSAHEETAPPAAPQHKFEPPISEDDGQQISVIASLEPQGIAEPPIAEDDTRPRPPVTPTAEAEPVPADIEGEPEFLDRLVDLSRFEPPRDPTDTQPKRPAASDSREEVSAAVTEPPEIQAAIDPDETDAITFTLRESLLGYPPPLYEPELEEPTASAAEVAEETQPDFDAEEAPAPAEIELAPEVQPEAQIAKPVAPDEQEALPESSAVPVAEPTPTPELVDKPSIWEVFGVPRPSETQQVAAVTAEPEAAPPLVPETIQAVSHASASPRMGLRMVLRRKQVRLRRS